MIFKFFIFLFIGCVLGNYNDYDTRQRPSFRSRVEKYFNLTQSCIRYETSRINYKHFIAIDDIIDFAAPGFLVRFPFYIVGDSEASIILTETRSPDLKLDSLYEFVIGTTDNTRTIIRKKLNRNSLVNVKTRNVLTKDNPVKGLIEISINGDISLTLENEYETFEIKTVDDEPLQISYISFGSSDYSLDSHLEFFYNCRGIRQPLKTFETTELLGKCKHKDVAGKAEEYNVIVQEVMEVNGTVRVPVMVKAEKDVMIKVHNMNNVLDPSHKAYTVVFGGTHTVIGKKGSDNLAFVENYSLFTTGFLAILLESKPDGQFNVFFKKNFADKYQLLISVIEPNPVKIKYIGVGSQKTVAQFYYDCPYTVPEADIKISTFEISSAIQREFYTDDNYYSQCFHYPNTPTYVHFAPTIVRPAEFLAILPVFVKSDQDVKILLSEKNPPNYDKDDVYEIVLGFETQFTKIRARKDGRELTSVAAPKTYSKNKFSKFWIEVTTTGDVRVSVEENNKFRPLVTAFSIVPVKVNFVAYSSKDGSKASINYRCPAGRCYRYVADTHIYNKFINLVDQPKNYHANITIQIQGERDANILLSTSNNANDTNAYEIAIGAKRNTLILIRKVSTNRVLSESRQSNLLGGNSFRQFLIQITTDGEIRVYAVGNIGFESHLVIAAYDPNPFAVKYYGFKTRHNNKVEFLYDC